MRTPRPQFPPLAIVLAMLPCISLALAQAPQAPPSESAMDSTRETISKWVETQGIISREKKDWQQGREILLSRIEIVKRETADIEQSLQQARASRAETEKAKTDLTGERDTIKSLEAQLSERVFELETRVRKIYGSLPESLREKIVMLYQRMPEDGGTTKISLAERFQNVLGILNEVNRLNSEIMVVSEIRPLSDGKPSEVKTLYVGLGQAYFVSARGEAGIGSPGEKGWTWQPANELASEINHALEILQNKSGPKFVPLPVTIR